MLEMRPKGQGIFNIFLGKERGAGAEILRLT